MTDFSKLPPGLPIWVTVAAALASIIVTITPSLAKLPGVLGALGRTFHSTATREVKRKLELDVEIDKLVDARLQARMQPMTDTIEALQQRVAAMELRHEKERVEWYEERDRLAHDLEVVVEERDAALDWIEIAVRSDHARRVWAAENGLVLPPPPLQPWSQFLDSRRPRVDN